MVGAFYSTNSGQPRLGSAGLAASVAIVVLQQGEEGFHGGVVSSGGDLAHRAGQLVATQLVQEGPGAELRPAVVVAGEPGRLPLTLRFLPNIDHPQ